MHLDVQAGIVVDITGLDGIGGSSLTNEIHAVDESFDPPPPETPPDPRRSLRSLLVR